jgi:dihydroneopterin aldolase
VNDRVALYGVECRVKIGVPAAERSRRQKILIDVVMETPTATAAARDDFRLAVDYWAVEKTVRETAETGERQLAETLAEQVAGAVLRKDKRIAAVTVAVHKKPAVMPRTREVVVEIRRAR